MRNQILPLLLFASVAGPACNRDEGVLDGNPPDLGPIVTSGPPVCFEGAECPEPDMAVPIPAPDMAQPWTPPPPGNNCNQQTFPLNIERKAPNIHLVIDRSGSMSLNAVTGMPPVGSETAKWADLSSTLTSLLDNYGTQANQWGMSLFPTTHDFRSCTAGSIATTMGAPATVIPQIKSEIAAYNATNLLSYNGKTPTTAAMQGVRDNVQFNDASRNNYVVLMTDGMPNCAGDPEAGVTPVISALYAQSPAVRTFVIGFGTDAQSNPALLNSWAIAGHTERSGAVKYYQAGDAAALQQAFQDIVVGVASCTFNLTSVPANPNLVVGYINGNPVANSLIDGFTYDAATQSVTFHGLSCIMIQNIPFTQVSVEYGCPASDVAAP